MKIDIVEYTYDYFETKYIKFIKKYMSKRTTKLHRTISNNELYHIRISNGCLGHCAYCRIKKVIGPQKSFSIDDCVKKFLTAIKEGNKNFLLVAEDVGSYGLDIKTNLPELLEKINDIKEEFSITICSISPEYVVKYIDQLEEILKKKKIININIPVQSGNERILKLMNLYSDIEKIKNTILRLKKTNLDLELESQLMLGFPTETKKEFENTLNLMKILDFDKIFLLKFPNVIRTEAYYLKPKITRKELNKRIKYSKKFYEENGYNMCLKKGRIYSFKKVI